MLKLKNNKKIDNILKIFIIGISGSSGSGKTYLAEKIKDAIIKKGIPEIEIISCDNYYKDENNLVKFVNKDIPEALDLQLLEQHLLELQKGKMVEIPKYNFDTAKREIMSDKIINGSLIKILIVEGLFVLHDENIRKLLNLKLFTLLDPDICLARRINRDIIMRNKSYEDILLKYQKFVKPSYVSIIEPSKKFADLIISTSEYCDTKIYLDVIINYVQTKIKHQILLYMD
jgi:uridine kinase